jgi:hypothetical protein
MGWKNPKSWMPRSRVTKNRKVAVGEGKTRRMVVAAAEVARAMKAVAVKMAKMMRKCSQILAPQKPGHLASCCYHCCCCCQRMQRKPVSAALQAAGVFQCHPPPPPPWARGARLGLVGKW